MKFLVIIVTVAILLSASSIVNFTYLAFAQDVGFGSAKNSGSGNSNNGVTGAGSTQSSNQGQTGATIRLSPNQGPTGTEFNVYGTGFPPGHAVLIDASWAPFQFDKAYSDKSGYFVAVENVPGGVTPGTYNVVVMSDTSSHDRAFSKWTVKEMASFTVTGQVSNKINTKTGPHPPSPPPPPPPPKQPQSSPTNSANGGGSSIPSITLNPASGYPGTEVKITGTNFEGTATLSAGGKEITKSSNISGFGDFISVGSDGSLTGQVTVPSDAQPGPYPIQIDSSGPTAKAIFTVLKEPTFADIKTTPGVSDHSTPPGQPGIKSSITSGKSTPSVTLPKTTGKTILPTTPSKPTSSINTGKTTGTIIPKTPTVKSCPAGSFAISGKCLSKGAIVAILQ